jgi:hypothetical protein
METRSKGKQHANPEAGPSLGLPIALYITPTVPIGLLEFVL